MDRLSYFTNCRMLACIITEKIFFPCRGNSLVKGSSPTDNTIFVNMYLGIVAFFEQGNNPFRIKLFIIVQHRFSVSTDKATIIL